MVNVVGDGLGFGVGSLIGGRWCRSGGVALGLDEEEDEHADDEEEEEKEDFAFGGFALIAGCLLVPG